MTTVDVDISSRGPGLSRDSLLLHASTRTQALAHALGAGPDETRQLMTFVDELLGASGRRPLGEGPDPSCDIGDDHTPYELSAAFCAEGSELRILAEPQGREPSLVANRREAVLILESLEQRGLVSLARFHTIADLFLPERPQGTFSIWLAASCRRGRATVKVYLNPEARGPDHAPAVVEEALARLGLADAWPLLTRTLFARGRHLDEPKYFSLDLASPRSPRVKLYARHLTASIDDLELAASAARNYVPGAASSFVRALAGGREHFTGRPLCTCLAFAEPGDPRPASATTVFPVNGYLDDAAVADQVEALFTAHRIDAGHYRAALEASLAGQRRVRRGVQSYVGFKRDIGDARPVYTVYFAAAAYTAGAVAPAARVALPTTAAEMIDRYASTSIVAHPFWQRVAREPPSLAPLAAVFVTATEAMGRPLVKRLATTIARIDDPRIAACVTSILYGELGGGRGEATHLPHFERFAQELIPHAPPVPRDALFAPARELAGAVDHVHHERAPYEGLGALLVSELFSEQVGRLMAEQLRRLPRTDAVAAWVEAHSEQEMDHGAEAFAVVRHLSQDHLEDAARGAWRFERAADKFFDRLYELCFPAPSGK